MKELYDNIKNGTLENISTTVLIDYYGLNNINNDNNFNIIMGVYSDTIRFFGKDGIHLLHKCYLTNRLDEFINKWYSYKKSGYYKSFENNKIGKTNLLAKFDSCNNLLDENDEILIENFEI